MSRRLKILISAGEASGDRLGAGLARALRAARPEIDLLGMGGDEMAEAGVRLVQHASSVAVVGIVEVLSHLGEIRRAMARLERAIDAERPDLVVPIDFPDFNLRLAARARKRGTEVVYFVSPQIWAWRRGRVRTVKRLVRRMLVLLPFEAAFYEAAGVPVTFVGHPAADEPARGREDRAAGLAGLGLDPGAPAIALLPGSRRGEVSRLFPVFLEAAATIARERPGAGFVVPRARTLPAGFLESMVPGSAPTIRVVSDAYAAILASVDAAIVGSGTATLDAALAGVPFVAAYRMAPLSYLLARWLVRVDHIALPNLIAGRRVIEELVQGDCSPARLGAAVSRLLDDPAEGARIRRDLAGIRDRLRRPGAFAAAAWEILREAELSQSSL